MSKPVFNNRENEQTKTEDGRTVFLSRSCAICVPVAAVNSNTGEVYLLLSQRGEHTPNYQHHYNFVCGYLDYDETLVEAAKRELWEEVGLNIDAIPTESVLYHVDNPPWAIKDTPTDKVQNVTMRYGLIFKVESEHELPTLSTEYCEEGEVSDAYWAKQEEAMAIFDSKEDVNPKETKKWAFNHYHVFREWLYFMKGYVNF